MYKEYELLDDDSNGQRLIHLTSGPFKGIIYSYGKVQFIEEGETLRLKFEYDLEESYQIDEAEFKNYIGDILVELISEGLLKNEIIFTGGTDENRTTNPNESDT